MWSKPKYVNRSQDGKRFMIDIFFKYILLPFQKTFFDFNFLYLARLSSNDSHKWNKSTKNWKTINYSDICYRIIL